MKVLFVVVGLFIIGFVALSVITTPQIKKLSVCLEEAKIGLESNRTTATIERWDLEKVCMTGNPVIANMQACYKNAESQTFVSVLFVESLAKVVKPNVLTLSKVFRYS